MIDMKEKQPAKTDVAVLLLFFTRTEHTKRTFAQICKARPSKLFLYQDGPRLNNIDDQKNILECRNAIESMIDWDCEVFRMYQEKNYGCDPSEFISQKWMFSHVDKGIIIEDDDVMAESFFPFCAELLDKYENDTRINMICGQNHLDVYEDCESDYFFSRRGGIWGWATWKRTIDTWDPSYKFLDDKYTVSCLKRKYGKNFISRFMNTCIFHKKQGKEFYESIRSSNQYVNSQFNIVPKRNMTCNIGIGMESTHSVSKITLQPRRLRRVFFQNVYEISFPLKHPKYVVEDVEYAKKVEYLMGGSWFSKTFRLLTLEGRLYKVLPFLGEIFSRKTLERVDRFKKIK